MARGLDAFRHQLVRLRDRAFCRRDDTAEGQPIPPQTRPRPEARRERSSSRLRRTSSRGEGGRSEATPPERPDGSGSSSEGVQARSAGQGSIPSSLLGGDGTYEFGSSSQQPPLPQLLAIEHNSEPGWAGPTLSISTGGDPGTVEGHTPRSTLFFDALGVPPHLHPPAP